MAPLDLRNWKEKLNDMEIGKQFPLNGHPVQSVYSAMRTFTDKVFSIRTDKTSGSKFIIRIK